MGHLQENGFDVTLIEVDDVGVIQEERGVAEELRGCHAAKVGDYLVEGHVQADLLKRFLEEDEGLAGITVPGMIVGPPGMEGSKPMPYDVLTFDQKGNSRIYESR